MSFKIFVGHNNLIQQIIFKFEFSKYQRSSESASRQFKAEQRWKTKARWKSAALVVIPTPLRNSQNTAPRDEGTGSSSPMKMLGALRRGGGSKEKPEVICAELTASDSESKIANGHSDGEVNEGDNDNDVELNVPLHGDQNAFSSSGQTKKLSSKTFALSPKSTFNKLRDKISRADSDGTHASDNLPGENIFTNSLRFLFGLGGTGIEGEDELY